MVNHTSKKELKELFEKLLLTVDENTHASEDQAAVVLYQLLFMEDDE